MALKKSKQRTAILEFLKTRKDHPTADVVYQNVKVEQPKLSLGTVYRNLTVLADIGEIQRLRVGDGTEHFDADISEHNHFVCEKCGSVIDLPQIPILDEIDGEMNKEFDGTISGHKMYFYGVCKKCKNA